MLQKTKNNLLLPFQRKKDLYIPLNAMGQLEVKTNKFFYWFIKIVSPIVGAIEVGQMSYGYYHFGWEGVALLDLIGFTAACIPVLLHPTFLFKPKKKLAFFIYQF